MNRLNSMMCRVFFTVAVFLPWAMPQALAVCDTSAVVTVLEPGDGEVTEVPSVDVSGMVTGDCVSKIGVIVNGGAEALLPTTTDWDGVYEFEAPEPIELMEGGNTVEVFVESPGGDDSQTVVVTHTPPPAPEPPPPAPFGAEEIVDAKIKLTFYTSPKLDLFNEVAYVNTDNVEMPCGKKITIRGYVEDPDNPGTDIPVFTYTIPEGDGLATCTTNRYRRVGPRRLPGVREIYIEKLTANRLYLYVFAWQLTSVLPVAKSDPGYFDYVARIPSSRLDIEIGEGDEKRTASGRSNGPDDNWTKLSACLFNWTLIGIKGEGRCNR